jgi:hypothetical protein
MVLRNLFVIAGLMLFGDCSAFAGDEMIAEVFAELSLQLPTTSMAVVCHGFGCQFRAQIGLTAGDRARLAALLAPGRSSPAAERVALAKTVAWFDRRVGPAAGTTHRVARASAAQNSAGQMDCIDISSNNTSLFLVLDQLHLLRHHHVAPPVSRGLLIDGRLPHTTAVLVEAKAGSRWAIDNWTHAYGEMPDVKPLAEWQSGR